MKKEKIKKWIKDNKVEIILGTTIGVLGGAVVVNWLKSHPKVTEEWPCVIMVKTKEECDRLKALAQDVQIYADGAEMYTPFDAIDWENLTGGVMPIHNDGRRGVVKGGLIFFDEADTTM